MEAFRQALRGWTVRILLSLLVLSFVLWGVQSDFTSIGSTNLARIGGSSVTTVQYARRFEEEVRKFSQETGQRISSEDARRIGLDQRVLAKLKLDEHARQLGLSYSEQAVFERVQKTAGLNKADGSFDSATFKLRLQDMGLSESDFFAAERLEAVRSQMMDTVGAAPVVPVTMLDAVNRFQGEQRKIDYFIVPEDKAKKPETPDEVKLKAYYEERKADYMAPEYRRLTLLVADPQKLKTAIKPSADEVKAAYEATKADYGTPETRNIEQIVFADLAAARKAHAELQAGKDFIDVAKAAGRTAQDIARGVITKDKLLDPKAAEAAFSFGAQTFTPPVEGDLAVSILRARDIKPATQKTLDEVKTEVEDKLKLSGAIKQLTSLVVDVEDKRAAAMTLKDIAKAANLDFVEVAGVDARSMAPDGKEVTIAGSAQVLQVAFGKDVGVESEPISLGDQGYVWVEVAEVLPARQKTYDEVKDAVKTNWLNAETIKALTETGRALVTRANAGEDMKKLATEFGLTVKTSQAFTRRQNSDDLPGSAVKLAYALAKDGAATISTDDSKGRLVMRLTEITPPKPLDDEQKKRLVTQLQGVMAADLQAQYFQSLDTQLGVTIDSTVMARMLGQVPDSGL